MNSSPFKIYNASAGSGKTFALVKEYLKLLLAADSLYKFKQVLAITFTNKAVAEMKTRVIKMLTQFSDESILSNPTSMFTEVVNNLNLEPKQVHEKSKLILSTIINNYAAFDISTIDKFTHKIIRTFAHDLKLSQNFEVELDTDFLLNQAVDNLITKAGKDDILTKVLVDFALEKTDDDKSWDISYDLNKIAKLLVNENHVTHLDNLESKTLEDFKNLKSNIFKKSKLLEKQVKNTAQSVLDLIDENNLEHTDFTRSTLPNHFKNAKNLNINGLYNNKLQENLENKTSIYNKNLDTDKANTIDNILPKIEASYLELKHYVHQYLLLKNIHKNITPLSVLNAINKELSAIKEEQNLLLISEFNAIIRNEIKDQPAPFIYERIGEKFKHYFIDEFQDTSEMQWQNLETLLENALVTLNSDNQTGSLMLVGDAKQAIYRWRGGKAEQFINLFNENEFPFPVKQDIVSLGTNYRSAQEIVNFNNAFFKHISSFAFSNPDYANIYANSKQNTFINTQGFINLTFLDYTRDDDKDEAYIQQVVKTIEDVLQKGYQYKDICILVRKRKEGVAIADALSNMQMPIISSETLMLQNSSEVKFIINLYILALQPNNNEIKVELLEYLANQKQVENKHLFFKENIPLSPQKLFKQIADFNFNSFLQLPVYDAAEYIVRSFNLNKISNAYIQFLLDEIFNYSQKQDSSFSGFIEFWNTKKDNLNIVSPIGQNAVQIMTIHKAKGLEFPVVIFPYAELSIYNERDAKVWFNLPQEEFNDFDEVYINLNKDLEPLNNYGKLIYDNHQAELELDNINLLYVTLTRPVEQLYVIGKKDINSKGEENLKTYSGLLINYLKSINNWDDSQLTYTFGNPQKQIESTEDKTLVTEQELISTNANSHNIKVITNSGYLWDTTQKAAIEKGNLIHNIMSGIKTSVDIDFAINDFKLSGAIDNLQAEELKTTIKKIVHHPDLKEYFHQDLEVYNERDILSKRGLQVRPDRIVIHPNNQATIIDYKTGAFDTKHIHQLNEYETVLNEMDLQVKKKILVYINDEIEIKET